MYIKLLKLYLCGINIEMTKKLFYIFCTKTENYEIQILYKALYIS